MMNRGSLARPSDQADMWGSDEHLDALDEIENHLKHIRRQIKKEQKAEKTDDR